MIRYSECFPEDLGEAWARDAVAVVPWGALEWHGAHLPLGLDGIVAERFSERVTERVDGVLLPGVWLPITTLPHFASLDVGTQTFRLVVDDLIRGLYASGARTIALVTGHYAQGHLIELFEAALRGMKDFSGLRVFAGTPLQPLRQAELLDHAGRYETSLLLAIQPELVRLSGLPQTLSPRTDGVLGTHPSLGSAEEGVRLFELGLSAWEEWLATGTRESLVSHYQVEFDALQPYVDAYYVDSWQDAIQRWWNTKS